MYTFAIVLGLILVGFILGFVACSLSVINRKKDDQVEFEILNKQNESLRFDIKNLNELNAVFYGNIKDYEDKIAEILKDCIDQKKRIDSLTQQIKDMQIVRTKPLDETVNILNENFLRNATFFAKNNHDVFMECIRTVILDTFIKEIINVGNFTYRVKMENEEIFLLKTPEKLVYFVKESYDIKKSLNAIRKN